MKAVILATLFALLLGIGAGVVIERDRRQLTPRDPGTSLPALAAEGPSTAVPDDRFAALEAEIGRLTSRISVLESRPAATGAPVSWTAAPVGPRPPFDAGPQVEAMRTEMATLIAKRDGEGLVFLARRLAALGEAGYPTLMEIAKLLLEDDEKDPREYGDYDVEGPFFSTECGALMAWSLAHPEYSSPAFRSRSIENLSGRSDMDVSHLFLAALRGEADPEVLAQLCEGIGNRMRPALTDDIEAAMRSLTSNEKAIDALLNGYSNLDETVSMGAMKRLSAPEVPAAIRERARANLALLSPPGTGYLMTSVQTGSSWHTSGLRTGDLIVEVNGNKPLGESVTTTTTDAEGKVTSTTMYTDWMSGIGEDDTLTLRVLRDGEMRTVTVHGNDGRWQGSHVDKPE